MLSASSLLICVHGILCIVGFIVISPFVDKLLVLFSYHLLPRPLIQGDHQTTDSASVSQDFHLRAGLAQPPNAVTRSRREYHYAFHDSSPYRELPDISFMCLSLVRYSITTGRSLTASAVVRMNTEVMVHSQIWLIHGKNVFDERYIQLSICMAYQPI